MRYVPRGRPLAITVAALTLTAAAIAVATVPASAATLVYEAENATLAGGAAVATDHAGYIGSGFVAGYVDGNKGAARTSFAVAPSAAGPETLALRYANGTGSAQTLSVYVNGVKLRQLSLANFGTLAGLTTCAASSRFMWPVLVSGGKAVK